MSHILSQIIKKKLPEWNERIFTLEAVAETCWAIKVGFVEVPIRGWGEYVVHQGTPFIILRQGMNDATKLWVALHELGHHLLHFPATHKFSRSIYTKADREANFFTAIAMMPTWLCRARTPDEIHAEYGYPEKIIEIRREISIHFQI